MTWGIWWILIEPLKCLKISFQWALFVQSIQRFELQKYWGVIFHDTEQWNKIWINPDLRFQKWHEVNSKERCKVWKNLLWWVSKAYNVSTRKFHRNCIMTQICDDKFKGKLTRGLKNYIRNLVSFHADSRMSWKFALWRAPFVQSI